MGILLRIAISEHLLNIRVSQDKSKSHLDFNRGQAASAVRGNSDVTATT